MLLLAAGLRSTGHDAAALNELLLRDEHTFNQLRQAAGALFGDNFRTIHAPVIAGIVMGRVPSAEGQPGKVAWAAAAAAWMACRPV